MREIVDKIFDSVSYWQDKRLLLSAISPEYYRNKNIMIKLLNVTSGAVSSTNEAKKDMWNHQVTKYNMGDDILRNTHPELLKDFDFAKQAILRYNRTYIYLDRSLKASRELALMAAQYETSDFPQNKPILSYMPELLKNDNEISIMATTRNIENLRFAPLLQKNKYFILDIMNLIYDDEIRQKTLQYIDQDLLNDKRFVSKLGIFDELSDKFKDDVVFLSYTVMNDIDALKKIEIFDEKIIAAAFKNPQYENEPHYVLTRVFKYIEDFNFNYEELDRKIKNKKLLHKVFWELAEIASEDYI